MTPQSTPVRLLSLSEEADTNDVIAGWTPLLALRSQPTDEREEKPHILVEGGRDGLLFLADLIIAQALNEEDCGVQLETWQRGLFLPCTEFSLYIHRLPCINDIFAGRASPLEPLPAADVRFLSLSEYADAAKVMEGWTARLSIRLLPVGEDEGKPYILIEGDRESLLFLADLVIAQALDEEDARVHLDTSKPGFLNASTEYGLSVHRLPCTNEDLTGRASPTEPSPATEDRPQPTGDADEGRKGPDGFGTE